MTEDIEEVPAPPSRARLFWGLAVFLVVNIGGPVVGLPLLAGADLAPGTKTIVGGVIVAVAELSLPVVIAILGKPGFAYIKGVFFKALRRYGPPAEVGRVRYRIGLAMLSLPVFFALVEPYVGSYFGVTAQNRFIYALSGDALLLTSFFVLGGDFWDKIRALFVHTAKARFPQAPHIEDGPA
jgi:hypothetical protein